MQRTLEDKLNGTVDVTELSRILKIEEREIRTIYDAGYINRTGRGQYNLMSTFHGIIRYYEDRTIKNCRDRLGNDDYDRLAFIIATRTINELSEKITKAKTKKQLLDILSCHLLHEAGEKIKSIVWNQEK